MAFSQHAIGEHQTATLGSYYASLVIEVFMQHSRIHGFFTVAPLIDVSYTCRLKFYLFER